MILPHPHQKNKPKKIVLLAWEKKCRQITRKWYPSGFHCSDKASLCSLFIIKKKTVSCALHGRWGDKIALEKKKKKKAQTRTKWPHLQNGCRRQLNTEWKGMDWLPTALCAIQIKMFSARGHMTNTFFHFNKTHSMIGGVKGACTFSTTTTSSGTIH